MKSVLKNLIKKKDYVYHTENSNSVCSVLKETDSQNIEDNDNVCVHCNSVFVKKYGLNRHLKICKIKNDIVNKLKIEIEDLKNNNKIQYADIDTKN